jgi:hypothetical protein
MEASDYNPSYLGGRNRIEASPGQKIKLANLPQKTQLDMVVYTCNPRDRRIEVKGCPQVKSARLYLKNN